VLESQFDHTLLVSEDDPELEFYQEMQRRNLAKLTILPNWAVKVLLINCTGMSTVFIFPTCGDRVKQNVCGATE
jgi:hypothetical protein